MHMKYFGDSYDLVKLSLINWMRDFGNWSIHPMLTEKATTEETIAFERFLSAPLISTEVLTATTDRKAYFSCTTHAGNLFLDPDTGLRTKSPSPQRSPEYLLLNELVEIASARPKSLTLAFDQSLPRGSESAALTKKLNHLLAEEVFTFAYVSHACFVVASRDKELIDEALIHVRSQSKLPDNRFLVPTVT